ncbi:MAG: hypothetical protein VCA36_08565, partial [Opitutales bacterium]
MKTIYPVPVLLLSLLVFLASCSTEPPVAVDILEQDPLDKEEVPQPAPELEPAITEKAKVASVTGLQGSEGNLESIAGSSAGSDSNNRNSGQANSHKGPAYRDVAHTPPISPKSQPLAPLFLQRNLSGGPSLAAALFQTDNDSAPRGGTILRQHHLDRQDRLNPRHSQTLDVHALALRSKKPSVHRIHPGQSFSIKGDEGTMVNFPAGSLAFETGEPCKLPATVKMWEFYNLPDILLAGLSTDCDEGFLQTGGM